ncbi:helix-turn-helix domain-containing protein [Flavobacterium sp. A45]|uniref:helix-turn-helix domain-containing protein n=1 Tax=Flavobacterium sp. A45 TaxID=1945862 RepID=UPI0020C59187|nr:helix-turn-helix domain-containing protein [Flavobacterium sp. A45]
MYLAIDSLKNKSYDYLDEKLYELRKDSTKASVYLFAYLHKAKREHNWKEVTNAYQNILHQSPDKLRLIYADSMILAAKKTNEDAIIGSAYLSKGIVYYGQKQQIEAMDNYLIANRFISKTNDNYQIHKVKYHIALIKLYIGFYDEAISLLKECVAYYKDSQPRPYLNSLHSLGLCYNKIGDYGRCSETNALGLSECNRLEIKEMIPYFNHSEGINEYYKKNYDTSIKNIQSSLEEIKENKDFANESIGNFYIGKSYWSLNQKNKALSYFQRVDKIFEEKNYLRPDLRQVYELLITYYKTKKNLNSQLYNVDQLLKADTLLTETNKYLIGKIYKEYDTKELISEKEKIKGELAHKKNNDFISAGVILLSFLIIVFMTYRHFKNRSLYKKKFGELMNQLNNNENKPKIRIEKSQILDINADTVATTLKQLEKFERDKKFLDKDWNLGTLSASFNSNSKYLSAIIFHYRDKRFVEYINDLRIDYIISLLHNEPKYKHYTNGSLAEEAGFSSTQRFANAFLAKTGMPTTYFMEELRKKQS